MTSLHDPVGRYVTKGAFYESALAAGTDRAEAGVWENQLISRVALYSPGGLVAQELAKNPTVLVVNDTVFAHGGLLPAHGEYNFARLRTLQYILFISSFTPCTKCFMV